MSLLPTISRRLHDALPSVARVAVLLWAVCSTLYAQQPQTHDLLARRSRHVWHLQDDDQGRSRWQRSGLRVESRRMGGIPQMGVDATPSMAWATTTLDWLDTTADFTLACDIEADGIQFGRYIGVAIDVVDSTRFTLFNFTEEKANSFCVVDNKLQSGEGCSINVFATHRRTTVPIRLCYRRGVMQFWVDGMCVQTRYVGTITSRRIGFVALGRQAFTLRRCVVEQTSERPPTTRQPR